MNNRSTINCKTQILNYASGLIPWIAWSPKKVFAAGKNNLK